MKAIIKIFLLLLSVLTLFVISFWFALKNEKSSQYIKEATIECAKSSQYLGNVFQELCILAQDGNAEAMLSLYYWLSIEDPKGAFDCLERSAELGNLIAQTQLGLLYAKDMQIILAKEWLSEAADQNIPDSNESILPSCIAKTFYTKAQSFAKELLSRL